MESIELKVMRLIRISFGPFQLGNLEAGQIEEVKPTSLKEQLGIFSNKAESFAKVQQRKGSTQKTRNKTKNADHSRNKSGS
jgi:23S rRNA pseudouridine2605 synthase